MPVLRPADTRASARTADNSNHLAFRSLGPRHGRPLQRAPGGYTHLFVTIDKFTKWIEAKPVATITAAKAKDFSKILWSGSASQTRSSRTTAHSSQDLNSKIGAKRWALRSATHLWHTHRQMGRSSAPMAWCSRASSQGSSIGSNLTQASGRENCHLCSGRYGPV